MEIAYNVSLQQTLKRYSKYLTYAIILLGLLVLAGWQFEIDFLIRPLPKLAAMNPTSAVCFLLLGCSFHFIQKNNDGKIVNYLGLLFSLAIFIISMLKLLSLFSDIGSEVDQYLYIEKINKDIFKGQPNRMAPNTAFCFLLASITLFIYYLKLPKKIECVHSISFIIALAALLSIIGYIYRVTFFYGVLNYIPMAILTAIGFLFFSLAILFSSPDRGIMKALTTNYSGSDMARLLIPAAIVVPTLLGYIRLLGHWHSSISTEFGVAALMLSIIIVFVLLIWFNAVSINKKDALRKEAEEKLDKLNKDLESKIIERTEKLKISEQEYRSLIDQATDGIFISNEDGLYTDVNISACEMLGYSKEELLSMKIADLIPEEEKKSNPPKLDALLSGKKVLSSRNLKRKDGTIFPIEINATKLSNGKFLGMVRDITERKIAQEKLVESEKNLRETLDNMMEGVQIHDHDWRYTYVNDSLVKSSHYKKEELLGYTLLEKYPGIEQTELFKILKKCKDNKIREHIETEFTFPNGIKAFFELSIQPVPQGLFILSIDITERKKVEEKNRKLTEELEQKVIERTIELEQNILLLKESENKFQKAFKASAAGMTITRLSDSCYLEVNDAFINMTGYSKEQLIGHNSKELGMIENFTKRDEILQQIRDTGSAKHFEMSVRTQSGNLIEVLTSVETIELNGENFAINIIFDITDRKRAEERLESVNRELEAFSYSVSHDLRAPLRAIDGYAKILEEDYRDLFDKEGKRLLGIIQYNSQKMSGLIDDLLSFSRLGRKTLQKTNLDMNMIFDGVIKELNPIKINPSIKINIRPLHSAKGDYTLITQVVTNLISNGIKYSSKKEFPIIDIHSEEKPNEILYTIKDNGVGFDMEYIDKLFGVFQRLHSIKEFEGTGVGLAIVQRIIHKHDGKVWAESIVGEGATFYFTLPTN